MADQDDAGQAQEDVNSGSSEATPKPRDEAPAGFPIMPDDTEPGQGLPPAADAGTTSLLARLLKFAPFLALHERAGQPEQHQRRAKLAFALDMLVRFATFALLLSIIAAVAWKTLAPLPNFWSGR